MKKTNKASQRQRSIFNRMWIVVAIISLTNAPKVIGQDYIKFTNVTCGPPYQSDFIFHLNQTCTFTINFDYLYKGAPIRRTYSSTLSSGTYSDGIVLEYLCSESNNQPVTISIQYQYLPNGQVTTIPSFTSCPDACPNASNLILLTPCNVQLPLSYQPIDCQHPVGYITVGPTGGTTFQYNWQEFPNIHLSHLENLSVGTCHLTVTNELNCTASTNVTIADQCAAHNCASFAINASVSFDNSPVCYSSAIIQITCRQWPEFFAV